MLQQSIDMSTRSIHAGRINPADAEPAPAVQADQPGARRGGTCCGLAPWQMKRVSSYIEENLSGTVRSGALAGMVRLSVAHFARAFKASFGQTPHTYVTRRRMERAKLLMRTTTYPLSRVALDCGMSDQPHFCRTFRRHVGERPSAWRRDFI